MTRDEILASLFGANHQTTLEDHILSGQGTLPNSQAVHILGYGDNAYLGVEQALALAGKVLEIIRANDLKPILVLVDSSSQRMSRHDELMGLSEYLAHLAKSFRMASAKGFKTIGLIHGGSAAGAFIATALACDVLIGLPGANPEVMDLPSMARVTKLSLEALKEKAQSSAVFAPGLDNMVKTGGISEVWDAGRPLSSQLENLLARWNDSDIRSELGKARAGRPLSFDVANEIVKLARGGQR